MKTKIFLTVILTAIFTVIASGKTTGTVVEDNELVVEAWMSTPFFVAEEAAEAVFEADLVVEEWMAVPFESRIAENELALENWMTVPFEVTLQEEDVLECWMVTPFEVTVISASL